MHTLAFLPQLGPVEYLIIGVVLLLLFGRRLPEVGRSLGQGIVQFKKGLKDVENEIDTASNESKGASQAKFESAKPPLDATGQDVREPAQAPGQQAGGGEPKTHGA